MSDEIKPAPDPTTNTAPTSRNNRNRRRRKPRNPHAAASVPSSAEASSNQPEAAISQTASTPSQEGRQARSSQRRSSRGTGNSQRNRRSGRSSNPEVAPPVTAPPNRGRTKRPLAEPRIGVGCIVLRGDEVLLVRERGRWSLPKGGLEVGELVQTGARRETYEETGLIVELRDLAFIVEFQAETWGHHLQFFYVGREVGGTLEPRDPDRDVQEAKFVPIRQLREYLRFRPRLVSLETWLRDRRPRHFVFDLDKEPAMLRKRRRVDPGRLAARRAEGLTPDLDDTLDEDEQP